MPQLRQNIVNGEWVVIAPERAKRPQDFIIPKGVKVSHKDNCPFCIGSDGYKKNEKVRKAASDHVYVVENRFPAFVEGEVTVSNRSSYPENGFYRVRASIGDHEVVILNEHDESIFTAPKPLLAELFEVTRDRYIAMKKDRRIVSIMPIYNHGAESGASIDHPHAQIFSSGIVTNSVEKELEGSERYFGINGVCVFCDMIKHELAEKVRIVFQNEHFIALAFFAGRFPFETWVLPKRHESQFELTGKLSMKEFADILSETLKLLGKTLDNPPLNFYLHTLPTIYSDSSSYHWHLEITPRVTNFGGYELGSGVIINVMPPEEAAHYLRESTHLGQEER
ncbi:MAG TPA: galactose-1-phosphate uridylyltransferase [bacterium]|nr:galactose-1-phosphate uridylyltransferase [bacterium]